MTLCLVLTGITVTVVSQKKGPVTNIRPPPIIASITCKGLKFTPKSAHPIDPPLLLQFPAKV